MIYQLVDHHDDGRSRLWTGRAADALTHFARLEGRGAAPRITDWKGRSMALTDLRACAETEPVVPSQARIGLLTGLILAKARLSDGDDGVSRDGPDASGARPG